VWHTTGEGKNKGHITCTGGRYGRENWDEVGVVGCSSGGRSTCRTHAAARSQQPRRAGADAERCQVASSGSLRMCAVFSMHGCLGHRLWAGGQVSSRCRPAPPRRRCQQRSHRGHIQHVAARHAVLARALQEEAAWDNEVWWIGTGRSWLPTARAAQAPTSGPSTRVEALYPRQSGRIGSRAARPRQPAGRGRAAHSVLVFRALYS
jgi:hypothetical protein